jgi:hypothetical protein
MLPDCLAAQKGLLINGPKTPKQSVAHTLYEAPKCLFNESGFNFKMSLGFLTQANSRK